MEDGLRGKQETSVSLLNRVLILVLVEDGLREKKMFINMDGFIVLILVLVEDGLRVPGNGYWTLLWCLNPCSCGRWSQRLKKVSKNFSRGVLILVLVEDGLREKEKQSEK